MIYATTLTSPVLKVGCNWTLNAKLQPGAILLFAFVLLAIAGHLSQRFPARFSDTHLRTTEGHLYAFRHAALRCDDLNPFDLPFSLFSLPYIPSAPLNTGRNSLTEMYIWSTASTRSAPLTLAQSTYRHLLRAYPTLTPESSHSYSGRRRTAQAMSDSLAPCFGSQRSIGSGTRIGVRRPRRRRGR